MKNTTNTTRINEQEKYLLEREQIFQQAIERMLAALNDATNDPPLVCAYELHCRLGEMLEKADVRIFLRNRGKGWKRCGEL